MHFEPSTNTVKGEAGPPGGLSSSTAPGGRRSISVPVSLTGMADSMISLVRLLTSVTGTRGVTNARLRGALLILLLVACCALLTQQAQLLVQCTATSQSMALNLSSQEQVTRCVIGWNWTSLATIGD